MQARIIVECHRQRLLQCRNLLDVRSLEVRSWKKGNKEPARTVLAVERHDNPVVRIDANNLMFEGEIGFAVTVAFVSNSSLPHPTIQSPPFSLRNFRLLRRA